MPHNSILKFARTEAGYRLRVEGKGTMRESRQMKTFVGEALSHSDISVVVDLSGCTYVDSTFLGCLMGLNVENGPARFRVATLPELARKLFGPMRMDLVLKISSDLPPAVGEYCTLPPEAGNSKEMARHIMECHCRLGEMPGPQQKAFAAIAQQMAKELETR